MVKVIVFMGMSGSGKSLQAKLLAKKLGYAYLSTGEVLRASHDPEVEKVLEEGRLVEPTEIEVILKQALDKLSDGQGIVMDGCLRIEAEARWLDAYLKQRGGDIRVLFLNISRDVAIERLRFRQREDDSLEQFDQKWLDYETTTLPVIDHYRKQGVLTEINGNQQPEAVSREIEAAL